MGSVLKKAMWVGRTTSTAMGLALALALVLGVATTALAAVPGDPLRLGKTNVVNAITKIVGSVAGPSLVIDNNSTAAKARALDLRVEAGKAPMRVNSAGKVANLNADQLDGKSEEDFYAAGSKVADSNHADTANSAQNADTLNGKSASEIGVNGWEVTYFISPNNSESPKIVTASCPAGKVLIGTGYDMEGGKNNPYPIGESNVVIDEVQPSSTGVSVSAYESEPISSSWTVTARAICATAP